MATILRLQQKVGKALLVSSLAFMTISMNACDAIYWNKEESRARVKAQGEIVVLTTQGPLVFSRSKNGETFGIDADLLNSFAASNQLKIRYVVLPDEDSILRALRKGEGDVAAARIRTPGGSSGFLVGPAYEESRLSLFCAKKYRIANIRDLTGKRIALLNKDNHRGLAQRISYFSPQAQILVVDNQRTQGLLADLSTKKYDCVIAEDLSGEFYLRFHSSLEKVVPISETYSMSWLLTPDNQDLLHLMQAWYQRASRNNEVMRILDRYRTYLSTLDSRDLSQFFRNVERILPTYKKAFREAAHQHRLPWQLIASVAYQESHWNPDAVSFTGVRGMMQLTAETAAHLGVEDRTDALQSIRGGSKYLRYLLNKMPKDLNSKDRLALALAAYNVGYAHLLDAQKLAESRGLNPYAWHHLKEVLPLLADPEYAENLEYGAARGHETVEFVERVKAFYNLMTASS